MGETEQIMNAVRGLDCFVAGYGQIAEKGPASSFLKDTRDSNMTPLKLNWPQSSLSWIFKEFEGHHVSRPVLRFCE